MDAVDQLTYVTPSYPVDAYEEAAAWEKRGGYNTAFFRILPKAPEPGCRNCQDAGFVMIAFCRAGPFRQGPPGHKKGETLMWFEGDHKRGQGWYISTKTISYECPACNGMPGGGLPT